MKACENCKFWQAIAEFSDEIHPPLAKWGRCRRFPPHVGSDSQICEFPKTNRYDWCGEFAVNPMSDCDGKD